MQTSGVRALFLEVGGGKMGTDGALHPGTVLPGHGRIKTISALGNIFTSRKQNHSLNYF